MALGQVGCRMEVGSSHWKESVQVDYITHGPPVLPITIPQANAADASYDRQCSRHFYNTDLGDDHDVDPVASVRIDTLYQLSHPSAPSLGHVSLDESTSIEIVETHRYLPAIVDDDLAERWVQDKRLHEFDMGLLFLFGQGIPLGSKGSFLG